MSERKLATIRKIDDIIPIKDADKIESLKIGGWNVVSKRGDFKLGDLCVFLEVDSFLPELPRYEFLRGNCYKKNFDGSMGFRLKTIKLRKTLSQGLALPLSEFPEIVNPIEGEDVTDILKITKFERPIPACLSGLAKGTLPSYIKKTDAERIQNLPEYFDILKGVSFEVSEKLDGSSMSIYFKDLYMGVCSRNLDLTFSEGNSFWSTVKRLSFESRVLNIMEYLDKMGISRNLAFQGELCGPGIQSNPLAMLENDFYLFNIWNIDMQGYITPAQRYEIMQRLNDCKDDIPQIKMVPIVNQDLKVFDEYPTMESLLSFANGKSILNPNKIREGLVFKSNELFNGTVTMFKAISNEYLLKEE